MDLVLHIGAHRTGSTMVERTITATIAANPDCGIAIWGPRRLRDTPGFKATAGRMDEAAEPVSKAAAVALDALASQIAADAATERARGVRTLILSEENFMGSMGNNFRANKFYPDTARRLAAFDSLFPMSPSRIALGVREYGSVWTSAFHYLPQVGKKAPPANQARDALMNDLRGWGDVVKDVGAIWPDTPMLIWQQEHLKDDLAEICATITGLPVDKIVVPSGKINARKNSTPRPEVFSDKDRKHLLHRYKRHIGRMKAVEGVTWIGGPE